MALYNHTPPKSTFILLTLFAVVMLFGFLIASGGMKQLFITMWTRTFSDGSTRHPVYTGVATIDYLIAMPVSFWIPAVTQSTALKLQSVVLYPALQALATWATIEGFRKAPEKPLMLKWAPASIFLWMWMGTGMFMPMYCYFDLAHHLDQRQKSRQTSGSGPGQDGVEVPYFQAVSMPVATVFAYLWPYIMIHFPPDGTTSAQLQTFIALNQFGSFFCYILVAGGSTYLSGNNTNGTATHSKNADAVWIKTTYAIFGSLSILVHLAVSGMLLRSRDPTITFSTVFVPNFANSLGTANSRALRMAPEVQFFLQWDFLLFILTLAVWGERTIESMYSCRNTKKGWSPLQRGALMVTLGIVSFILNPGTVLSAILYFREDFLRYEEPVAKVSDDDKQELEKEPLIRVANKIDVS